MVALAGQARNATARSAALAHTVVVGTKQRPCATMDLSCEGRRRGGAAGWGAGAAQHSQTRRSERAYEGETHRSAARVAPRIVARGNGAIGPAHAVGAHNGRHARLIARPRRVRATHTAGRAPVHGIYGAEHRRRVHGARQQRHAVFADRRADDEVLVTAAGRARKQTSRRRAQQRQPGAACAVAHARLWYPVT